MARIQEKTSGGITYLEREGTGPVVVFLHGIGSNASSFGPLIARLPDDVRAIAWNAPGYGGSRPLDDDWPLAQDYARALAGLLDRLEVPTAVIVGHSLGTLMGAAFAAAYPGRVDRLILASCACGYRIGKGDRLPDKVGGRIDALARQGPVAFAAERAPRLVFEPDLNPDLVARVRETMAQVEPRGYGQAVHMLASGDLPAAVAQVQATTGFIIGTDDRVTPEEQTLDTARAWGAATGQSPKIVRIDRAGHAVYLQNPQDFIEALAALGAFGTNADGPSASAITGRTS